MTIIKYFGNLSTLAKRGLQAALLGSMTALLVSCGGGGTNTDASPTANGPLSILPKDGSMYANVPIKFNVNGGRPPYTVVSNEQTVLPLNFKLNGHEFEIAPAQPGVFDPQTDPNEVPARTVHIDVRDTDGVSVTGIYKVLQNFLTGYSLSISTTATCSTGTAGAVGPAACAGADSLISLRPASNGLFYARKQFRFTANYGAFSFITDSTGITGPTVVSTADDTGALTARIRVTPNALTQYAQFRMTDIVSGNYRDFTFVILNATAGNAPLSTLPSSVTFTGADSSKCGTGTVNLFVFGGTAPYRAATTAPNSISITPAIINQSGDAFTVSVFNPQTCIQASVVVTDATGANVTFDVTTVAGSTAPVVPLTVIPAGSCLQDNPGPGNTITVLVSGGAATKVMSSSAPSFASVPATMSGSGTFTVTAGANYATLPGPPPAAGTPVTITVTDGVTSTSFNVTRKTTCP